MVQTQTEKHNILIVDDDRSYRSLLRTVFSDNEFAVSTAEDGSDALTLLKENEADYDLIITDLQMPQLDGISLITEIRDRFPQVPVIIMSAYMDDERFGPFRNRTDFHCLAKPFRLAEVINLARRILKDMPS